MSNEIVIYQGETPAVTGSNDGATSGIGASAGGLTLGQPSMMDEHLTNPLQIVPSTAESNAWKIGEDDLFDSKSGSENHDDGSGDDDHRPDDANQRPRKRQFHRHTRQQIQQMEEFFKDCQRPDDRQRKELSLLLGLEPLQIKFWFQNKRTQIKMQQERRENQGLRAENEKLRAENMTYREVIANASCTCGGPKSAPGEMSHGEHNLRVENARLKEEIDRITTIAAKYLGKPSLSYPVVSPPPIPLSLGLGNFNPQLGAGPELYGVGDLVGSIAGLGDKAEKQTVAELAVAAMEELTRLAKTTNPLWIANMDTGCYMLNKEEYFAAFPRGIGPRPLGFRTEASRETAVVRMNHLSLVELFMDVNQWSTVFSWIVSRATVLEVLSTGVAGNYDGALQVMTAELHVLSPLVPTRETNFARFCKKLGDGSWAVVDVSLDGLRLNPSLGCRRRPSGCLIDEIPGGRSMVTWVEHVEVDDRDVHNAYEHLLNSGLAFGARRWVSTLDRQCERFASAMVTDIPHCGITNFGRRSLMKLAERMVISFCGGASSSTSHSWTTLSEGEADDEIRVITRKSVDDPSRPSGIVLCAATSFWLPVSPKTVFDFLRDHNSRNQWDILANGGLIEEITRIPNGRDPCNCVSLLKVAATGGGEDGENGTVDNNNGMVIVQETSADPTGCFLVYAPVDNAAMDMVLGGGDPSYVALLPSGFAILADGFGSSPANIITAEESVGCLLTVAFQILVDSASNAKLSLESVATVNNLIASTAERIKDSMVGEN
ncbi:homeobox-leucine zipper protein HDG2-like isoform X2 [Diospyros lotus]|uniref:homeobox-leucine zipper protein HDG2-like isoform X2 n=1 Tax=Diospyros lotus TaxID=55363 RepID=UPI00224D2D80|nr:homeobox-leucine zipper protein HDG2-like isoform X2 [Diospyros lotus]